MKHVKGMVSHYKANYWKLTIRRKYWLLFRLSILLPAESTIWDEWLAEFVNGLQKGESNWTSSSINSRRDSSACLTTTTVQYFQLLPLPSRQALLPLLSSALQLLSVRLAIAFFMHCHMPAGSSIHTGLMASHQYCETHKNLVSSTLWPLKSSVKTKRDKKWNGRKIKE